MRRQAPGQSYIQPISRGPPTHGGENALSQARRRNPEATAEEVAARWDKKHRRWQAREAKRQAEWDHERQERVARWRPIAERMAQAVADDAALVRAALGLGRWADREALLTELLPALGGNTQSRA